MDRTRLVVVALAVVMLAASCADSDGGTSSVPPSTTPATLAEEVVGTNGNDELEPPEGIDLDSPANPIDISFEADSSRSSAVTITPEGGTVATEDAEGNLYELSIPAGALLAAEEIVMTPVSGIEGIPFDGEPIGIVLEPEGLVLLRPAVLTVRPSTVDPADMVAAATFVDGEDFYLTLSETDGSTVTMTVNHFSLRITVPVRQFRGPDTEGEIVETIRSRPF